LEGDIHQSSPDIVCPHDTLLLILELFIFVCEKAERLFYLILLLRADVVFFRKLRLPGLSFFRRSCCADAAASSFGGLQIRMQVRSLIGHG
jgi:hypothetical protein